MSALRRQRTIDLCPYTYDTEDGTEALGLAEFFEFRGTYYVQEVDSEVHLHFQGGNALKANACWRELSGQMVALSLVTGAL